MFYYYFKSKQDIYIASMENYISERLKRKCEIMEADDVPFKEKLEAFREMVGQDVGGYLSRFEGDNAQTITDSSYKLWDLIQMLGKMREPYSKMLLQGIREGKIDNPHGIDEDNVESFATFILYGAFGMIYNSYFADNGAKYEMSDVVNMVGRLL